MRQLEFIDFPAPAKPPRHWLHEDDEEQGLTLSTLPFGLERIVTGVTKFVQMPLEVEFADGTIVIKLRNSNDVIFTPRGSKGSVYGYIVEYLITDWEVCLLSPDGVTRPVTRRTTWGQVTRGDGKALRNLFDQHLI